MKGARRRCCAQLGALLSLLGTVGLARAQPAEPTQATGDASASVTSASTAPDPGRSAADAAGLMSDLEGPALETSEQIVSADQRLSGLSLYGFADVGFYKYFLPPGHLFGAQVYEDPSFYVGNLNTYLAGELGGGWRSLVEVRFTYLPNGSRTFSGAGIERVNTTTQDYTNLGRARSTGSIFIERAWIEYSVSLAINLRAGSWLTPYGIWNVDHGSPTIIGVYKPYIINQDWFPERQTGIEAHGSVYIDDTQLGYHLTLSNGRGAIDAYKDLDNNKGVGGRLYVKNDSLLGTFTLGLSAYRGNYTDRPGNGVAIVDGALVSRDPPTLRYEEVSYAADLKWELEGLLVQSEFITRDVRYTDAARARAVELPPSPAGFQPDTRERGVYFLVGYRTRWLNLMPFAMLQYVDRFTDAHEYSVGLNLRPSPRVALKAEYKYILIQNPPGLDLGDLDFLGLQLAWSF